MHNGCAAEETHLLCCQSARIPRPRVIGVLNPYVLARSLLRPEMIGDRLTESAGPDGHFSPPGEFVTKLLPVMPVILSGKSATVSETSGERR